MTDKRKRERGRERDRKRNRKRDYKIEECPVKEIGDVQLTRRTRRGRTGYSPCDNVGGPDSASTTVSVLGTADSLHFVLFPTESVAFFFFLVF